MILDVFGGLFFCRQLENQALFFPAGDKLVGAHLGHLEPYLGYLEPHLGYLGEILPPNLDSNWLLYAIWPINKMGGGGARAARRIRILRRTLGVAAVVLDLVIQWSKVCPLVNGPYSPYPMS